MSKLTIICPGRVAGGVNLLLARVGAELHRSHGYRLGLVDHADGALRRLWADAGVPFDFHEYRPGERQTLPPTDIVLFSLLLGRLLERRFDLPPETRLVAWSTAPQDAFKYLPTAFLFNRAGWSLKRVAAHWLHRAQTCRIHAFLAEGSARGGVFFMDAHNHEANVEVFGPGLTPAIIPICTADAARPPRPAPLDTRRAYWVGRVEDFKTEALLGFVRATFIHPERPCFDAIVVVGDGEDLPKVRQRCAGLPVVFRGYLSQTELADELASSASLVAGHGLSILEAARLGVPALVVDGTYEPLTADRFRGEWLQLCPPGYVGKIARAPEAVGRPLTACLRELRADPLAVGLAGHERWRSEHTPAVVAARLAQAIRAGSYSIGDFRTSGAARPGWFGRLIDWSKERLFGRRY
ncbi:MAG: hypothetical protein RLZZ412_1126 [Verrucomicrobiota bacterium]